MGLALRKNSGKILEKLGMKPVGVKIVLTFRNVFRGCLDFARTVYIPMQIKRRTRDGVLAINLDSDWLGLGARIVATLELLMHAEENGLVLWIKYGYNNRKDDHNYFEDLFKWKPWNEKIDVKNPNLIFTHIRSIDELKLKKDYNRLLSSGFANQLFERHLVIKDNILEEVNKFSNLHFKDFRILGLHYRGTDKVGEAPKVELGFIYDLILELIDSAEIKFDKLFISSDESSCIDFFKQKKLPLEIVYREDIYRSKDGAQFHRNFENNMSIVNHEALVNCLLLAEAALLIKTASILSDCCKVFNPELSMIILNEPHSSNLTWWPARELNQKYLYKPSNALSKILH